MQKMLTALLLVGLCALLSEAKLQFSFIGNDYGSGNTCCFPPDWEGYLDVAYGGHFHQDPRLAGIIASTGMAHYDTKNQRRALMFQAYHAGKVINGKMLKLFNERKQFLVFDQYCVVFPLTGSVQPRCVPADATYVGNRSVGPPGKKFSSELYRLVRDYGNAYLQVHREQKLCYPVRNIVYNQKRYLVAVGFADFNAGIADPSVFDVPKECQSGTNGTFPFMDSAMDLSNIGFF